MLEWYKFAHASSGACPQGTPEGDPERLLVLWHEEMGAVVRQLKRWQEPRLHGEATLEQYTHWAYFNTPLTNPDTWKRAEKDDQWLYTADVLPDVTKHKLIEVELNNSRRVTRATPSNVLGRERYWVINNLGTIRCDVLAAYCRRWRLLT